MNTLIKFGMMIGKRNRKISLCQSTIGKSADPYDNSSELEDSIDCDSSDIFIAMVKA